MKPGIIHIGATAGICICMFLPAKVLAQERTVADSANSVVVIPGPQYKRSGVHHFLWGKHYRKEWSTPVTIKKIDLDTYGLKPYESGNSKKTKNIRLRDADGREYVMRSIDKTFMHVLPENVRGTMIETIANDQVSSGHPFSAVMVAPMAEAAGIYHTWPRNVYLPQQDALDSFNIKFGNTLYILEQRPDENWETAPNFGNSKKIIGTDKLFEELHKHNNRFVDQDEFVRARLFDMLIGDWSRHEDQWRWASFKNEFGTIYKPIPRDRDQSFTKFDGVLLKLVKSVIGLGHQQTFGPVIKNIRTYNFSARNIDRVMTNMITKEEWVSIARDLQLRLNDSVISQAVQQMPPELFPISGPEIIENIKSRRERIVEYAEQYYHFLSKEIDITGTDDNEYFEITGDDAGINVTVYDLDKSHKRGTVVYNRSFAKNETNEVRIYGWNGNDVYHVNIPDRSPVTVRIVGGPGDDKYDVIGNRNVHIYDNVNESPDVDGNVRFHLSPFESIHRYNYDGFRYNKAGLSPSLYYSKQHIIYFGIAYNNTKYKWRREPYASSNQMYFHYSPTQNALRTGYEGVVNQFTGRWNLLLNANYDWVKVINFYGVGNDTRRGSDNRDFYRLRMEHGYVSAGLSHGIGAQGNFTIAPFFQTVKLIIDPDRFLIKDYLQGTFSKDYFDTKKFVGITTALRLQNVNHQVLPTKGVRFTASAAYTKNIEEPNAIANFGADLHFYHPLSKHWVVVVKNGFANTTGDAEFYQLNPIGGRKLRGYRRERFWGNTTYYNNNEIQYLFNVRSTLFNGTAGLLAFADQGRVWSKGQQSNTWHWGYGGGIILSPFHKVYVAGMYGISRENRRIIHLDLRRTLR